MRKNTENKRINTIVCEMVLAIIMVLAISSFSVAKTQFVELVLNRVSPEKSAEVVIFYNIDGPDNLTTGIGLRFHFNKAAVSGVSLLSIMDQGLIGTDMVAKADVEDYDRNPATDQYIILAWMDIDGQWPANKALPLELASLDLELTNSVDSIQLGVSTSSVAAGYKFRSSGY